MSMVACSNALAHNVFHDICPNFVIFVLFVVNHKLE